jgi:hypothetical protein
VAEWSIINRYNDDTLSPRFSVLTVVISKHELEVIVRYQLRTFANFHFFWQSGRPTADLRMGLRLRLLRLLRLVSGGVTNVTVYWHRIGLRWFGLIGLVVNIAIGRWMRGGAVGVVNRQIE